ncbi:MAG: protein, containing CobQ/CobB/MinD/ParA nucleotide binding domain, and 4Fe-4S binding [Candidatus Syntrophoarchaeum caldarius]|uniref:Protein, containing CobQ/CobB/MinD/ParA nucleotide binding domain, and 4Fe-4S binding n=1 Tax=Candidatus Syntropharchaeum caldarium TaxID=1838285 RepID=A0A1F2P8I9_9EURY|nr:MAG: protein, containing CobQ/CobB/MinD/ParA nucleotide binding domain, and 4Fe-4S binding [Candidatus Syntrophoarchaeum caldarius]
MKQIAILSGKGGTGKTTLVASFAALAAGDCAIADCDVDAPDLHLILKPEIKERMEFTGSKTAHIDTEKCTCCGVCEDACRFDAIENCEIDPFVCEGCGVCAYVCPEKAIQLEDTISGYAFISNTRFGPLSHAELKIAEEASGKLVTLVRNNALEIAEQEKKDLILIDGSPGIGCPVIASLTGVNLALVITEPTQSGLHDLERVLDLTEHFKVQATVCINKHDINTEMTEQIQSFCEAKGVDVAGRIPFDPIVTAAMVEGKTVIEFKDSSVTEAIKQIWDQITKPFGHNFLS